MPTASRRTSKGASRGRRTGKPRPRQKPKPKPSRAAAATRGKAIKPAARGAQPAPRPSPARPAAKGAAAPGPPRPGGGPAASAGSKPKPQAAPRKGSRRSALSQRRGPDGELLAPGELLLPSGPQSVEEIQYLLRGCVAAEHGDAEAGIAEVLAKRTTPGDPLASRSDLARQAQIMDKRFAGGAIEPLLPTRAQASRRTFASVVERARMRRREIGGFLRGLHIGHTETSHMDSHGEASLQSLMEWAARLENLMEAEEPDQADYSQFHRGLDHLENTTEALIVDVEATLRRLRDRIRG